MADRFREKLERVILEKNAMSHAAYGHPLETAGLLEQYLEFAAHIRGLVVDTTELLNRPWIKAKPCFSKARRARCSTSIMALIPM